MVSEDRRPEWLKALPEAMHPRSVLYYQMLHDMGRAAPPGTIVEIGTNAATGAAHLAAEASGPVYTIDINPACQAEVDRINTLPLKHPVEFILGNSISLDVLDRFRDDSIVVLFIDGNHTFVQAYSELTLYWPKLCAKEALILCDDIAVHPEMEVFWEVVSEQFGTMCCPREQRDVGFGWFGKEVGTRTPKPLHDVMPEVPRRLHEAMERWEREGLWGKKQ